MRMRDLVEFFTEDKTWSFFIRIKIKNHFPFISPNFYLAQIIIKLFNSFTIARNNKEQSGIVGKKVWIWFKIVKETIHKNNFIIYPREAMTIHRNSCFLSIRTFAIKLSLIRNVAKCFGISYLVYRQNFLENVGVRVILRENFAYVLNEWFLLIYRKIIHSLQIYIKALTVFVGWY